MDQAMKITAQNAPVHVRGAPETRTRPRSADTNLRFRIASGSAGLKSIERVWRRMTAHWPAVTYYQTYDWYRLYLEALEYREKDWHFFVVYQGYTPVGIIPLRLTKTSVHGVPLQALELPDHPHVPFADLIMNDRPTGMTAAFTAYLRHSGLAWDALILRRVAPDSPTVGLFAPRAILTCVVASLQRVITSAQITEEDKQKARQRLARVGRAEYVASRDQPTLDRLFQKFLQAEAAGWQGHPGLRGAIRDDSRLVRYYRRLIDLFGDNGCEIGVLKLNGQPVAAQFCLLSNNTRYVLKTTYDAPYSHRGDTRLLLDAAIGHATGNDSGSRWIAVAPWNYPVSASHATFDVHRFNTTRRGLAACAAMRAARASDPAYHHYRRLHNATRGYLRNGLANFSRTIDRYMRCP
jgi:hypothetical protein